MRGLKHTAMAILVTLIVGGTTASCASAGWFVGGTELKGSALLKDSIIVGDQFPVFLIPGITQFRCEFEAVLTTKGQINAVSSGSIGSLRFARCKTTEGSCHFLNSAEFVSTLGVDLRALLDSKAPEDRVLVLPQTKNTLAVIEFREDAGCPFQGALPIHGTFVLGAPLGQTEETTQTLTGLGSLENKNLEIGIGDPVFIDAAALLLTLESSSKWSFK